jgi:hypothetical protein
MTAPFEIANRFDLLVNLDPHALDAILGHFNRFDATPSTVKTTRHADGTLAVKVVVERLAETRARDIQIALRKDQHVLSAQLEHFWP